MANFPSAVEQQPDGSYLPNSKAPLNVGGTALESFLAKLLIELRIMNMYNQQQTQLLMGLNAVTPGSLPLADDAFALRQDPLFLVS